jgi:uncharacterized protein affecting Mg2+/Co2+ transport
MESNRETATFPGHLSGMSREADCIVGTTKELVPGTDSYKYSRIMIFDAPEDLPEGRYTLTFDGQRFPVQKAWQAWITVVLGA